MKEQCKDCFFWIVFGSKDDGMAIIGDCHRYPPSVYLKDRSGRDYDGRGYNSVWPETPHDGCCGEFVSRKYVDERIRADEEYLKNKKE